jgi:hypothetical protein
MSYSYRNGFESAVRDQPKIFFFPFFNHLALKSPLLRLPRMLLFTRKAQLPCPSVSKSKKTRAAVNRMKRFRALEAQMYRSKGPHEDGGSALDTANLVRCIDLGLFTPMQRALNSAERSFYKALNTLRELQKTRGFVPANAQNALVAPTVFPSNSAAPPRNGPKFSPPPA